MYRFSFIDFGEENFLTDEQGKVLMIECSSYGEAEEWLLTNGEEYGWTNSGTKYWCWEVENGDVDIDDL